MNLFNVHIHYHCGSLDTKHIYGAVKVTMYRNTVECVMEDHSTEIYPLPNGQLDCVCLDAIGPRSDK